MRRAREPDHKNSQCPKKVSPERRSYQATHEGLGKRHSDAHAIEPLLAAKQEGRLEAQHHAGDTDRRHANDHAAQATPILSFALDLSAFSPCLSSSSGGSRTYLDGCSLTSRGLKSATMSGVRNLRLSAVSMKSVKGTYEEGLHRNPAEHDHEANEIHDHCRNVSLGGVGEGANPKTTTSASGSNSSAE